jgi:eukaryotic translation initiation factor 2C
MARAQDAGETSILTETYRDDWRTRAGHCSLHTPAPPALAGAPLVEIPGGRRPAGWPQPPPAVLTEGGADALRPSQVLQHEVGALRAAFAELEADYTPCLTFVVCGKRHHARFFAGSTAAPGAGKRPPGGAGGATNPPPGTVVDTGVTHPRQFDFYLVAHAAGKGTARPTHYHVLLDENGLSADALQALTYRQCHLWARCTSSVSLVPAAYYAHLAAFRARVLADDGPDGGLPQIGARVADQMYIV